MPGLPIWAEKYFSLRCTEGGAIATRPDEDTNGWDYFIELPDRGYHGPAESRPPKDVAYAQVKSIKGGRLATTIKLSNMQISSASEQPWFIILVAATADGRQQRMYGLHVWSDLIRKSLKAARKAAIDDAALHARKLSISFPAESEISGDVVAWMRSEIDAHPNYTATKSKLFETLGYEDGYGTATVTVAVRSEEEVARLFLGLSDGVSATAFSHVPARFGIPDKNPRVFGPGRVVFEPEPVGNCELRVRGSTGESSIVLRGLEYAYAFPIIALENRRIRLSAPPVEIIAYGSGKIDCSLSVQSDKRYSLDHLEEFGKLLRWADSGPINFAARRPDGEKADWTITFEREKTSRDRSVVSKIIAALQLTAQKSNEKNISVSFDEIRAAMADLGYFFQVLSPGSMRLILDEPEGAPPQVTIFLYYVGVTIGEWTFYAITKRKVNSDLIVDGARQLTATGPIVVDAYVMKNADGAFVARVTTDFDEVLEKLGDKEKPLAFGNLVEYVRSTKGLQGTRS